LPLLDPRLLSSFLGLSGRGLLTLPAGVIPTDPSPVIGLTLGTRADVDDRLQFLIGPVIPEVVV
jgi:hypothetical protein